MDQDIEIINAETRKEKIKNIFIENKKLIISIIIILILGLISFFGYQSYKSGHREGLANKYNSALNNYENGDKAKIILSMKEIIEDKDKAYSPLALYFLIDKDFDLSREEINKYFDIIINEINLDKEIKNLNIYKKALYNSEFASEDEILTILKPIINGDSVWKSHALFLIGEYFYIRDEKKKSKEFFEKIISLSESNVNIRIEAEKRIRRDLSE